MRELIYKDEAVKRLREMVHNPNKDPILLHYERILRQGSEEIQAIPEAVIRCKDCKYGGYELARPNKHHPCDMAFPAHWRCYYHKKCIPIVSQDDFCSRAERRTDG